MLTKTTNLSGDASVGPRYAWAREPHLFCISLTLKLMLRPLRERQSWPSRAPLYRPHRPAQLLLPCSSAAALSQPQSPPSACACLAAL